MDTFKNFVIGLVVSIVSLILFGIISLTWPVLLGLGSIFFSIIAFVLFILIIFYVLVLIGYLVRAVLFGNRKS